MVSLFYIFYAAIFNAVMDSVENEHVTQTIFKDLNPKFWYKRTSWAYAKKTFGYKWDGWHMAKSLMIISLCLAVVTYHGMFNLWADFVIFGLIWNGTFNLFYNHIFKKS
jgi:hypothetical protein